MRNGRIKKDAFLVYFKIFKSKARFSRKKSCASLNLLYIFITFFMMMGLPTKTKLLSYFHPLVTYHFIDPLTPLWGKSGQRSIFHSLLIILMIDGMVTNISANFKPNQGKGTIINHCCPFLCPRIQNEAKDAF